jgi:hypothetical protein
MSELTVSYLDAFDGEPRILDLTVAERLGFTRPRTIRQLIERNRAELESYGPIAARRSDYHKGLFDEFWLNETQSLLVCLLSRTDKAAEVRRALIEVFNAWRRGQLAPSRQPPALTRAQLQEINSQAWALASEVARPAFQEHKTRLIRETRDRIAAGLLLDPILESQEPKK